MSDYDCMKCGACCVSAYEDESYVHLTSNDVCQLSEVDIENYVIGVEDGPLGKFAMATTISEGSCRCSALSGSVGVRVSCSIYERRPAACRKFTAGSTLCDIARREILGISDR